MVARLNLALSGLLLAVLPACSSFREERFYLSVVSTEEKEIPSLVLLEDKVLIDEGTKKPVQTPTTVKLVCPVKKDGSGYEDLKLGVRALAITPDGSVRGERPGESPYLEDKESRRWIQWNDEKRQLFVLRKNKTFQP